MYPIPANATRIRYLEATPTGGASVGSFYNISQYPNAVVPYIDTGIIPTGNTYFEVTHFMPKTGTSTHQIIHGIYGGWGTNNNRCGVGWAYKDGCYWGCSNLNLNQGNGAYPEDKVKIWVNINGTTATYGAEGNGFTVSRSATINAYNNSTIPIFLFCRNGGNPSNLSFANGLTARVYSAVIKVDGVTVRSFVPVRVGSVGYLFDRVSGQFFGNAWTGDFVLGSDTFAQGVIPTRMMVAGVRKKQVWPTPLYTGVNLVGSSVQNNSGILSGFTSSSYATMPFYMTSGATSLEAVIKFKTPNNSTTQGIWGCAGSSDSYIPFYFEGGAPNIGLRSFASTNGTSWAINAGSGGWTSALTANTDTILRSRWDGSYLYYDIFKNGSWTTERTLSISSIWGSPNLVVQLGTNRGSGWPFLGTIDLNYTYFMRDGQLLWEGTPGAYKRVAQLT